MKQILLSLTLLILSQHTLAGWHYDQLIGFNVHTNGGVSITVKTTHECGSTVLSVPNPESEYIDRIISVLLSHQAQDKPLHFAIQSCAGTTGVIDRVRTY